VFALLKMKPLLLVALLASPPLAAWALRGADSKPAPTEFPAVSSEPVIRIPVEIVTEGSEPRWVEVEVRNAGAP
jgi:hypothetical protein